MQRCSAKSKQSGVQCKNYALSHKKVCRMHGANGGPHTKQGAIACRNAPLKHGYYTKEMQEERRFFGQLIKGENVALKNTDDREFNQALNL